MRFNYEIDTKLMLSLFPVYDGCKNDQLFQIVILEIRRVNFTSKAINYTYNPTFEGYCFFEISK